MSRGASFVVAALLIVFMVAVQVYAIETEKAGWPWLAAVIAAAALALAGVVNYYRKEWK